MSKKTTERRNYYSGNFYFTKTNPTIAKTKNRLLKSLTDYFLIDCWAAEMNVVLLSSVTYFIDNIQPQPPDL